MWTGGIDRDGYGRMTTPQGYEGAHRWSYREHVGPIPPGMQIDHVKARGCVYNHCVNPAHLEAVTLEENLRRQREHKTHCKNGHLLDEANARIDARGYRVCRACCRAWALERYYRIRGR